MTDRKKCQENQHKLLRVELTNLQGTRKLIRTFDMRVTNNSEHETGKTEIILVHGVHLTPRVLQM